MNQNMSLSLGANKQIPPLPPCAFRFVEIQSPFCLYLVNEFEFLTKFGSLDPNFNRSILTILYLKSKTSAHVQIALIHYYVLFVSCMIWIWNLGILFDNWSWSMILSTWSRDIFWKHILVLKFFAALLPDLLRPNVIFMTCLNFDISTKLHTSYEVPGSHVITFMTWSCDPIFRGVSSM